MISPFLRPKDIPEAIKKHYDYDVTLNTINRWRQRHPLVTPARLTELCRWFEQRINDKRALSTKRKAKRSRL